MIIHPYPELFGGSAPAHFTHILCAQVLGTAQGPAALPLCYCKEIHQIAHSAWAMLGLSCKPEKAPVH